MNHKWKGTIDIVLQNNLWKILRDQLATQSPIELKDNSKNSKTYPVDSSSPQTGLLNQLYNISEGTGYLDCMIG